MRTQLIAKAVFFTLLMPGLVTIVVPYWIVGGSLVHAWPALTVIHVASLLIALVGAVILVHCIWAFAFIGGGTLAPVDPPKHLVVRGFYRYTRNPMYLSVLSILAAESLLLDNAGLLAYAALVLLGFHLMVTLYEEPHLRTRFGHQYAEYCRLIPRWGVSRHPFGHAN